MQIATKSLALAKSDKEEANRKIESAQAEVKSLKSEGRVREDVRGLGAGDVLAQSERKRSSAAKALVAASGEVIVTGPNLGTEFDKSLPGGFQDKFDKNTMVRSPGVALARGEERRFVWCQGLSKRGLRCSRRRSAGRL